MKSNLLHRRSIRLKGYDYTQPGAYFVTICTHGREMLFGQVVNGEMILNEWGQIVWEEWFRTAHVRPYVRLYDDEFVVMPNHIHGIIWIVATDTPHEMRPPVGATRRVAPTDERPRGPLPCSLGAIIGQFKSIVTKRINARRGTPGAPVWQRNYYEHIIRTERALNAIRHYIAANPRRWHLDRDNPAALGPDPWAQDIWRLMNAEGHSPPRVGSSPRLSPTRTNTPANEEQP